MLEYAKQAAYGLAPSRTFKITFVGPEGSGKTSSIRTLLGKAFNPDESSTIGAVLGIPAIIKCLKSFTNTGGSDNTEDKQSFNLQLSHAVGWKEASVNDMQQIRDKEFNKEMFLKLDSEHKSDFLTQNSDTTELIAQKEANDKCIDKQFNMEMSSKLASASSDHKSKFFDRNSQKIEPVIIGKGNDKITGQESHIVEKEIDVGEEDSEQYAQAKNVVFGDKIDELDSHACISDFAGQLTFFNFQLFFLKKHDTVVITFNASLKLTAKVIPRERYNHAKMKRTAAGMMSIIENIDFWLQSVSGHAGTNDIPKGCISRRSPTAILCATHAENLSTAEMASISKHIFGHLSGKLYADHLPTDPEKAIIFISNKNRRKFAHNIIMMQQVLLEAGQPTVNEKRPISYLKLEQSIATEVEEGVPMISVEEFTKLVNKAGIPGDRSSQAVNAALQYCSTRGTILHFPEEETLSDIVFISPNWLSSIFSKIISTHDQVPNKHPLYHAWKRYDTYAILEEEFLDHVLELASVCERKEIIISLMELFNLLAEIHNDTCFDDEPAPPQTDKKSVYSSCTLIIQS